MALSFKQADAAQVDEIRETVYDPQSGQATIPTGKFYVVDAQSKEVVGEIEYPLDFCPSDTTSCPHGTGAYFGLYREDGTGPVFMYHSECFRPTRKWWDATFRALVSVREGVKLPW